LLSADDIIRLLALKPHPEGGHYRQTFRDARMVGGRPASTAIYFLLKRGERSHWHRVDAVETWHWHAGSVLTLKINDGAATDAGACLAGRRNHRRLDARWLHRGAGLRIQWI
jgi:uncharacterized protein